MPRKPINEAEPDGAPVGGTPPQPSVMPAAAVRKVAKSRKSTGRKTAAKKSKTARAAKAPAVEVGEPSTTRREPTDDEVRIRAYFIAERRMQLSMPGSEAEDWLEARRQLQNESGAQD